GRDRLVRGLGALVNPFRQQGDLGGLERFALVLGRHARGALAEDGPGQQRLRSLPGRDGWPVAAALWGELNGGEAGLAPRAQGAVAGGAAAGEQGLDLAAVIDLAGRGRRRDQGQREEGEAGPAHGGSSKAGREGGTGPPPEDTLWPRPRQRSLPEGAVAKGA